MYMKHETYPAALLELVSVANQVVRAIPPLFPLTSSVAVNPYLGQTGESIAQAAARMARVGGVRVTAPQTQWAEALETGEISQQDLEEALDVLCVGELASVRAETRAAITGRDAQMPPRLPSIADLAAKASGIDWPAIIDERIGVWAASHFDQGQALWPATRTGGAFGAWREFASRDITPEIHGLKGFGAFVAATPRSTWRTLGRIYETIGLTPDAVETVFHNTLMDLGGWSQYARYLLWQAELSGETDATTVELMTIRLVFEEALFEQFKTDIEQDWSDVIKQHSAPLAASVQQLAEIVVQHAAERAQQRRLAEGLKSMGTARSGGSQPDLQAAFCIDVRSEVFRRALEAQSDRIETFGVAGFFGVATMHHSTGSDIAESQSPVLLQPPIQSSDDVKPAKDLKNRYASRAKRAWGRFKLAAVSSFAFVEATGPIYAGKLIHDAFALQTRAKKPSPKPVLNAALALEDRVSLAQQALRAMSLTKGFAPVVLIVGHGANVTNNPHASTLNCGACGGHSGDVNARLLADLLNDGAVRAELLNAMIDIPQSTVFVAAVHDTTTDTVTLFDGDLDQALDADEKSKISKWLRGAGAGARAERARYLPRAAALGNFDKRAADWAELRPEWGLAGCSSFIAAKRTHTRNVSLGGQAFLHSYDWHDDPDFSGLETLMTAPVVVASWISLQYFGSAIAPDQFGGGNKTLHNVVGGIGVLEGNSGALRSGLPYQSIHDGSQLRHKPLRLSVVIQAPPQQISAILQRHDAVRALFDNGWLHLLAMDDQGQIASRYNGSGSWVPFGQAGMDGFQIAAE
jgi:uncharacterized protein YbcC (UPF0753/DUF2309 family)